MRDLGQGRAAAALVAVAAAVLLAGCGSSDSSGAAKPADKTSAAPSGKATGTPVTVSEKEFSMKLSTSSFTSGTYTFSIKNHGSYPHNLAIAGPGVASKTSATLQGGQSGTLTVALEKGKYQLWCAVPTHKEKGMHTTITVG